MQNRTCCVLYIISKTKIPGFPLFTQVGENECQKPWQVTGFPWQVTGFPQLGNCKEGLVRQNWEADAIPDCAKPFMDSYCTGSHAVFTQVFIKGRIMWVRQRILSLWANIRSRIFISSSRNTKFLEILNLTFFSSVRTV